MQDAFRWWDALDEVAGISEERAPSPWDVLNLVARRPGPDRLMTDPAKVDLATSIGTGDEAYRFAMPFVLTDGSHGQLSPQSRLALLQAAVRSGCALRLPDPSPDLLELGEELGADMWAVVGPRRGPHVMEAVRTASVVELQLTTVGPEGGLTRSVDPWDSEGSLVNSVDMVRSVSGRSPVVVNTGPITDREMLRQAVTSGADAVMVQGVSRSSRMHNRVVGTDPLGAVASLVRTVARTKRPEGTPAPKLVVSGGFKDALETVKAISLGADLVVMGTAPRISMGCTLCDDCGPGECPKVGHGLKAEGGRPDWKTEAEGLSAYLGRLASEARHVLAQMGCVSVTEASPANLEAYTYDAAAVTGAPLAGYGETLPMWLH
jgi:glutamate synthase domain-containing protein 2